LKELEVNEMSPYALNVRKGTVVQSDALGKLPGGVAVPISESQANIAKHIIDVVVFDRVAGIDKEKATKGLYGIDSETLEKKTGEVKTYKDFMRQYKNPKIAAEKYKLYKKDMGIA